MTKLGGIALVVGATVVALAACKRTPPGASPTAVDPFAGIDCTTLRTPAEPDLTAWDTSSRTQLDKLRRQGVVAVRYETHGCEVSLELLPNCIGPKNRYVYSPFNATDTKIAQSSRDLLVQLPLGAANVAGLVNEGRALRIDERLVGTVGLPAGSTITDYDLVGPECKRATHVIQAVYVGAFARAMTDARAANATNLFTAPPADGMTREGSVPICERAQAERIELSGCAAPIRLALLPLGRAAPPSPKMAPPREPSSELDAHKEAQTFDPRTVERTVRDKQANLKRKCWEVAPDTLRRVTISVAASIDTEGRVVDPQAQLVDFDGSADVAASVARCITAEIQSWQFPSPEKATPFTVPFHLIRQ